MRITIHNAFELGCTREAMVTIEYVTRHHNQV